MGDFVAAWWPFLLLLVAPQLVTQLVLLAYHVISSRIDHAIPDDLPHTAGEWLRRESGQAVVVHTRDFDGYHPEKDVILLRDETYFKRDPIYWATAAHELGHQRLRRDHPVVGALLGLARLPSRALNTVGLALVAGNVLYGLPGLSELGLQLLAVALLLEALVLLDEAAASATARRLLAGSTALSPRHLRAVRWSLRLAFMTYVVSFASRAALLALWSQVLTLTGEGLYAAAGGPLTGWRFALAVAASVVCAIDVVHRTATAVAPAAVLRVGCSAALAAASSLTLFPLALLVLVVELWDRTAHIWTVYLAMGPLLRSMLTLFGLPLMVVFDHVGKRLRARFGPIEQSAAYRDARTAGEAEVVAGNQAVTELSKGRRSSPGERALVVLQLLYVPLLIDFWLR